MRSARKSHRAFFHLLLLRIELSPSAAIGLGSDRIVIRTESFRISSASGPSCISRAHNSCCRLAGADRRDAIEQHALGPADLSHRADEENSHRQKLLYAPAILAACVPRCIGLHVQAECPEAAATHCHRAIGSLFLTKWGYLPARNTRPRLPPTSRSTGISLATTTAPHASASASGRPNPSAWLGKSSIRHLR